MFGTPFEDVKHSMQGKLIKPNTPSKTVQHMERQGQFILQDRTALWENILSLGIKAVGQERSSGVRGLDSLSRSWVPDSKEIPLPILPVSTLKSWYCCLTN